GVLHVGVADDRDVVAERLKGAHAARRQIEVVAGLFRRPQILLEADDGAARGPVHHFHADQAKLRRGRGGRRLRPQRPGRRHRVQERQRHGHTHTLQHRAPGDVLLLDEHVAPYLVFESASVVTTGSALLIWNAAVLTIPRTNDENRKSFCAAFRTIARTDGSSKYSIRRPSE